MTIHELTAEEADDSDGIVHSCHWCRNEGRWLIGVILFEAAGVIGVIVCWYLYLTMKGSK